MLNENDRLTIVGVANKVHSFNDFIADQQGQSDEPIEQKRLYTATVDNKKQFTKFLDALNKTKEITNHTLTFQYSFKLMESILSSDSFKCDILNESTIIAPVLMVYISRGLLSQMTEAKVVLETIAAGQNRLRKPVVINTCAIILGKSN